MLELRSFHRGLKRISAGFLSKLVQLEELHMVGVEYCSYSILRELEFLSRLTALTLIECAKDVIYSNLGFSSKLTQYALTVGNAYRGTIDDCGKKIALEATETTPLGDWICHLLKESEVVHSTGKGSNKVLTELQLNKFQNVKCLSLFNCNLLILSHEVTKFPNLYELRLESLECLTHFCSDNVEGIEFPQLQRMILWKLPKFQKFCPTSNNSITHENPLFNEKGISVSTPSLKRVSFNCELVKVDDLNKLTQQRFNYKEQKASQGTADGAKSEASDDDESEATNGDQSEANDGYKSEANDGDESEATDGDTSEAADDSKG